MKAEEGKVAVSVYSEAFKYEVVKSVQGGMGYKEACSKYGIKAPSTVHGWVKSGRWQRE